MDAPRRLELVAVGNADEGLLRALGEEIDRRLGTASLPGDPMPLRDEWWDPARRRFRSAAIVDALLERAARHPGGGWWLGVAEAELCAPEFDRVFGEATVAGPCAVVGLPALRARTGDDPPLLWPRLVTTTLHELGHLAGAEHCGDPVCVMFPSRELADTDRKGNSLCEGCLRLLSIRRP